MTTHTAASVHDEDEVEVSAVAQPCLFGLLIMLDFKEVLWLHWVESRHKRDRDGDFVTVSAACVLKLWHHHICSAVKQVNRAVRLGTADLNLGTSFVLRHNNSVAWDTEVRNRAVGNDFNLVGELVCVCRLFLHSVLLVVGEESSGK